MNIFFTYKFCTINSNMHRYRISFIYQIIVYSSNFLQFSLFCLNIVYRLHFYKHSLFFPFYFSLDRRPSTRDLLDEKLDNWVTAAEPSDTTRGGFRVGETKAASHCSGKGGGCWKGLIDSNRSVNFSISYADPTTFSYLCKRFQIRGSPISAWLTSHGPNHCAANSIAYMRR